MTSTIFCALSSYTRFWLTLRVLYHRKWMNWLKSENDFNHLLIVDGQNSFFKIITIGLNFTMSLIKLSVKSQSPFKNS